MLGPLACRVGECRLSNAQLLFLVFEFKVLQVHRPFSRLLVVLESAASQFASSSRMHVVAMVPGISIRRHEAVLSIIGLLTTGTSYLCAVYKNIAKGRDRNNAHASSFAVWQQEVIRRVGRVYKTTRRHRPPAQEPFFHPNLPISAPIGLRLLLLSLEQAAYSKSIANITPLNSTIAFQSNDDNGTVMCVIGGGLYPNGASVALAINNSIARTDSRQQPCIVSRLFI